MIGGGVLERIASSTRLSLGLRKEARSQEKLRELALRAPAPRDFAAAFARRRPGVIAEIKFASPSEGSLIGARPPAPLAVAASYLHAGATALSVLTEEAHFRGSLGYLAAIRAAQPEALLLMKDFVISEYQLLEARYHGADAVLLIVALLGEEGTRVMLREARALGLSALVEVHDEAELEIALRLEAPLIGINNRDLRTLAVSLETSFRLAERAPPGAKLISESGIRDPEDLRRLRAAGFAGCLVGTSLMKTADPGAVLARLLAGGAG
jgi:indole-3-glycerol phosphate synthase